MYEKKNLKSNVHQMMIHLFNFMLKIFKTVLNKITLHKKFIKLILDFSITQLSQV